MSIAKLSLGLCVLVFTALLAPLGESRASAPAFAALQPAPAVVTGGDQVTTSQDGDLKLKSSKGEKYDWDMRDIKKDADGKITEFYVFPATYKWDPDEKRYNPTTTGTAQYYEFEFLSEGRYKYTLRASSGNELDKGSLDT